MNEISDISEKHSVLFVDDEPNILNSISRIFRSEKNIKIHTASSCKEAVKLLSRIRFEIVVTDYKMPVDNGLFLLNHIKENYPEIISIMLDRICRYPGGY